MNRTKVESSNLASIGFDPKEGILEIEFKSGAIYQYYEVPTKEFDGLMNAESKGKYLNENIKNIYRYKKIPKEE